eukprot:11767445-Prorocentrum_lima.AAC.1
MLVCIRYPGVRVSTRSAFTHMYGKPGAQFPCIQPFVAIPGHLPRQVLSTETAAKGEGPWCQ